ncbi:hypothetical protein K438DRAFT_1994543 [Mycena galopus ATCC 62051]|nr:hypothetical protein K438DRAFT_1994543 [Mycena galopus ATCC 62051]
MSSGRSRVSRKDFASDTGNVGTADPASDMIRVRLKVSVTYLLSVWYNFSRHDSLPDTLSVSFNGPQEPEYFTMTKKLNRWQTYREQVKQTYLTHSILWDTLAPPDDDAGLALDEILANLTADIVALRAIDQTRYLRERNHIPKAGNLHIAWEYAQDPSLHPEFVKLLRVSPLVFNVILLIKDHPVFHNNSNVPQTPVDVQLPVVLYRLGRYGNAASVEDVARVAGIGVGTVELFTDRCFAAIESLHNQFIRQLTPGEKELEKRWIDEHLGFVSLWREGWVMYNGTIVVLYAKPGLNGEGYYTLL